MMRMPKRPPGFQRVLGDVLAKDQGRLDPILHAAQRAAGDRAYLHWDKLRHKRPPTGLSHEEWWAALKMARAGGLRTTPLLDVHGNAFRFGTPDPVPERLHEIDKSAAGNIEMSETKIANPGERDRYIIRSLMEEAITSSQLEGAATTRRVAKEMIRSKREPKDTSERMILNNYLTIQRIRSISGQELTPGTLLDLHRILTRQTLEDPTAVGRFRRKDEKITVATPYDEVLHTPPPAITLPGRLAEMCRFANGKSPKYFIHPVIRSVMLHFWLAYDHPFVDGNGRCARALFYWSMLRQGYWLCEFISISEIIRKAPARYGRAFLYTETDENDLTYFILYHLEVIRRAIRELHEYIAEKTAQVRRAEQLIRATAGLNHRQYALLSHAIRHPDARYTTQSHRHSHGVVNQTARTDLLAMTDMGLLEQRKVGKRHVFTPVADLEERLKELR